MNLTRFSSISVHNEYKLSWIHKTLYGQNTVETSEPQKPTGVFDKIPLQRRTWKNWKLLH
jgi:hypothetical protein